MREEHKLPYDVKIGAINFRKGVALSTLVNRATAWHEEKATQRADTIDECIVEALKYDSVIDVVNSLQAMK